MKILVHPHTMEIGGSQLNALELAREMQVRGHTVVVFGPDGVLVEVARSWGLEYLIGQSAGEWPSRRNIAALRRLVRERGIDVVHGYEGSPVVDLALGPHLTQGTPLVATVLSMSVPPFLPPHVPLVVGTADLAAGQQERRRPVYLMEPPIDTVSNAPIDPRPSRARWGLHEGDVVVSVVCRLTTDLEKLQGVLSAIGVVGALADDLPVRMIVTGEGPGQGEVEDSAETVNRRHGRPVILATGALTDPREVYAASDIVIGMGSSALKGMAFEKPLVVQGSGGFWRLLDETSLADFMLTGWYGIGGNGAEALAPILRGLVADPAGRARLGALGRQTVVERFSLESAGAALERIYLDALSAPVAKLQRAHGVAVAAKDLSKFRVRLAVDERIGRTWGGRSPHRILTPRAVAATDA